MSGACFKTKDKNELGMTDTTSCQICGKEEQDITHTLWDCEKIHTGESRNKLRELKREDIPRNIKLGAPNAMSKQIDANFFVKNSYEVKTTNIEMLELLGFRSTRKQKQGQTQMLMKWLIGSMIHAKLTLTA